jgi:hypothetical protein
VNKIRKIALFLSFVVPTSVYAQTTCTWTNQTSSVAETCGSVGIGTSAPATLLELNGAQPAETIRYTNPAGAAQLIFYENSTAKGILQSLGSTLSDVNRQNALEMVNAAQGPINFYSNRFTFGSWPIAPNPGNPGVIQMVTAPGTPVSGRFTFGTDGTGWKFAIGKNQAGTVSDLFTIQDNGSVGIGTTTPQYKLDVNGAIHATQVIGATYQDVAEWVPAGQAMEAGVVVVLDREKTNQVIPSQNAYDTAVAGVVSAHPGVILGEEGGSKAKIATTGRVRVHVDATTAPIRVGDLLVTSNKRGLAMRSEPIEVSGAKMHRPGTLIGKALEPLTSGEGDILVLLSLQ